MEIAKVESFCGFALLCAILQGKKLASKSNSVEMEKTNSRDPALVAALELGPAIAAAPVESVARTEKTANSEEFNKVDLAESDPATPGIHDRKSSDIEEKAAPATDSTQDYRDPTKQDESRLLKGRECCTSWSECAM